MRRPADGATSSVAHNSIQPRNSSACCLASSLFASAISVSRLSTSSAASAGISDRIALSLGSRRGSAAMSYATGILLAAGDHQIAWTAAQAGSCRADGGPVPSLDTNYGPAESHHLIRYTSLTVGGGVVLITGMGAVAGPPRFSPG